MKNKNTKKWGVAWALTYTRSSSPKQSIYRKSIGDGLLISYVCINAPMHQCKRVLGNEYTYTKWETIYAITGMHQRIYAPMQ